MIGIDWQGCLLATPNSSSYIMLSSFSHIFPIEIEWASAQVPPTPLYLGGTVGGERERDREGEGEGEMDGWMDGWIDR